MRLRHRPGLGLRAVTALLGVAVVAANAAVLLSDRAPGVLRALFGDTARDISARLDAGSAGSQIRAHDIGDDSIVHFGLWMVAMVVVGLAVWSWAGLILAAITVAATSLAIEVAQGRYSSTRAVEASDAAFNLLGVGAGAVAAAVVYLAVELLGRLVSGRG